MKFVSPDISPYIALTLSQCSYASICVYQASTFYTIDTNVMFGESAYTVSKGNTSAKITLVLSKSSAMTVTVTVVNFNESAIGNLYSALWLH